MEYKNPTPVAVALVPISDGPEDAFLGIVRNLEVGKGGQAFPGGFVDEGESIEMALAREVKEECGIDTDPKEWSLISSAIVPQRNQVLVFGILSRGISREDIESLELTPEVSEFVVLNKDSQLVFPLHQEVLNRFLR